MFSTRTHDGQPQACILVYNGARAHEHDSASSPYTGFTPRLRRGAAGRSFFYKLLRLCLEPGYRMRTSIDNGRVAR